MSIIPLASAYLCADCHAIGDTAIRCAACASEHLLCLASVLDRETDYFDLIKHLDRQRLWSDQTFGPGARAEGVVDHIGKELSEILQCPSDLSEWIDVVILALDGASREGYTPKQIVDALVAKQTKKKRVAPMARLENLRTRKGYRAYQDCRGGRERGGT